jgi:hypothetical protein
MAMFTPQVAVDGRTGTRVLGRRDLDAIFLLRLTSGEFLCGQSIARFGHTLRRDFRKRAAGEAAVPPREVVSAHSLTGRCSIFHDRLAVPANQLPK